jgi:hypothetical protein
MLCNSHNSQLMILIPVWTLLPPFGIEFWLFGMCLKKTRHISESLLQIRIKDATLIERNMFYLVTVAHQLLKPDCRFIVTLVHLYILC